MDDFTNNITTDFNNFGNNFQDSLEDTKTKFTDFGNKFIAPFNEIKKILEKIENEINKFDSTKWTQLLVNATADIKKALEKSGRVLKNTWDDVGNKIETGAKQLGHAISNEANQYVSNAASSVNTMQEAAKNGDTNKFTKCISSLFTGKKC